MDRWCEERAVSKGAVLDVERVWELGKRWYANRLDASWRGRTVEEMEALLEACGLTDAFWRLR